MISHTLRVLKTSSKLMLLSFESVLRLRFSFSDLIEQIYEFANQSLSLVVMCVSFMGVIIVLEYSFHMKLVIGNDSMIPGFAMILLTRELAPMITALLLTSKMGAGLAAELAAMKITEQTDAYRLLGLRIVDIFVAPRMIASMFSTLALGVISLFVASLGAMISASLFLSFTPGTFMQALLVFVKASDFALLIVKCLVFGLSIPVLASAYGMEAQPGAEGVGQATTDAVVTTSLWIIFLDFAFTAIFSII